MVILDIHLNSIMEGSIYGYLCRNQQVKEYFLDYSREDWNEILLGTLLFGIQSIQATHSKNLSVQELHEKLKRAGSIKSIEQTIPTLKSKLKSLHEEIVYLEDKLEDKIEEKPKKVDFEITPEEYHPPKSKVKKVDFWNQTDLRKKNQAKNPPKVNKPKPWAFDFSDVIRNVQRSPGNFENGLSNAKESLYGKESQLEVSLRSEISNKLKPGSRDNYLPEKEIKPGFDRKFATDPKDFKYSSDSKDYKSSVGSPDIVHSGSKYKSSGSSMSHYNPTEDMKKFYRNEFSNLIESKGTKYEDSED
jgi:hypothetical protein